MIAGYATSFVLLSLTLRWGMTIGVAYGVWAAVGVGLVALVGAIFLEEGLTWLQVGGLVLIAAGVLALELGAAH